MKKIELNNFKCFNRVSIPLNGLTLLTGTNGAGKSSVIQAFTLLRRTIEHCAKWNDKDKRYEYPTGSETNNLNVELNGAYCLALGTSAQVLRINSNDDFIEIKFIDGESYLSVNYDTGDGNELHITPNKVQNTLEKESKLFAQEFFYLNAERIGPRISQGVKFYDYPNVGWQGEFAAQILGDSEFAQKFVVDENRREAETESPRIEQQTKAWMNFVLPGFDIKADYKEELLSAQIRVDSLFTRGNPVLATNVGFGISYVLPIVITGLLAPKGSFMIVENPEAHLHPSAQSRIGRFLAAIANAGVNVIVETHSDHVINGIQIAAVKNEINSSLVTINYFSPKELQPECVNISLNEKGELSEWPKGFFDQTQIDYMELFNANKRDA